jgi:glycosyltransferase involved in cell wall biosynthesis
MPRVLGLCSGDPFSPRSFSGSVRQLYLALDRQGALAGAVDVDGGKHTSSVSYALTVINSRRVYGRRLLTRWTERDMRLRSRRAELLLEDFEADAALMYGTDFFPAAPEGECTVPVGAAMDATFAQIARSGEDKFASLSPTEVGECVENQRRVFARCRWLFPRSEWCAASLEDDYGVPRDKMVVTGAGPNVDEELPVRRGHDGRTLLFVGRDWHRKNGPLVLDALRLARRTRPDLRLVVVGPEGEGLAEDGVEWLGPLDGDQRGRLLQLYAEASLYLCPSRFEPFGIALLEAMAAGCPVVALDRGAAREMIEDGVTGALVDQAEPRQLADAILHWTSDRDALVRAGELGRERVRANWSWDTAAERVVAAFEGSPVPELRDVVLTPHRPAIEAPPHPVSVPREVL